MQESLKPEDFAICRHRRITLAGLAAGENGANQGPDLPQIYFRTDLHLIQLCNRSRFTQSIRTGPMVPPRGFDQCGSMSGPNRPNSAPEDRRWQKD